MPPIPMSKCSPPLKEQICPCCLRLVQMTNSFDNQSRDFPYAETHKPMMKDPLRPEALKNIELSSQSIAKLLEFLKNREDLFRIQDLQIPSCDFEVEFLSAQNLTSTENRYIALNETEKSAPIYQNKIAEHFANLQRAFKTVEKCPWYWGNLSSKEANKILQKQPIGTFFLRNSNDPRFLFTLSLKSELGLTNLRIDYSNGKFCFDSVNKLWNPEQRTFTDSTPESHKSCPIFLILSETKFLKTELSSASSCGEKLHNISDVGSSKVKPERETFLCSYIHKSERKVLSVSLKFPLNREELNKDQLDKQWLCKQFSLWTDVSLIDKLPLSRTIQNECRLYPYPV